MNRPDLHTTCCTKPRRDNAYLCDDCAQQLSRTLGDTPWHIDQLETSIGRAKGIDYRTKGGTPSAERPLAYNPAAADAHRRIRATLARWVTFCHHNGVPHQSPNRDIPEGDNPTPQAMSRWLMWRVDGLTLHPRGVDALNELTAALDRAQKIIDRPEDKEFYGPCSACGRDLYGMPKSPKVNCDPCDLEYDTAKLNAWMSGQIMGRLVTATEAAGLLSRFGMQTSVQTVQRWGTEKRVPTKGHKGRASLYLFDDLFKFATSRRSTDRPA